MWRSIAPRGSLVAAVAAAAFAVALIAAVVLATGGSASAQDAWLPPPEANAFELPARELSPRPRMSVAIGMGSTFDDVGFPDGTHTLPAFFATGGMGDGLVGFDFQAFASSAAGRDRNPKADPVDRLAFDALAVLRPAARVAPVDRGYPLRVLRTLAAELGLGLERDGRSLVAASRFTVHLGARVELPLTPAGQASELRLRLAVSRSLGLYTPKLSGLPGAGVTEIGDTAAELYAGLVVVF